jgi:hypothetical protein
MDIVQLRRSRRKLLVEPAKLLVCARQFRLEMGRLDGLPHLDAGKEAAKLGRAPHSGGCGASCAAGRTSRRLRSLGLDRSDSAGLRGRLLGQRRRSRRKQRQFLAKLAPTWYCFSERCQIHAVFHAGRASRASSETAATCRLNACDRLRKRLVSPRLGSSSWSWSRQRAQ